MLHAAMPGESSIRNIASSASQQLSIPPRPHIPLPSRVVSAFPDLKKWQEDVKKADDEWRAKLNVAIYGVTPP